MKVLDYSAGFPGAAVIRAAGYGGAMRYIGTPGARKCTTAGELTDFLNNGLAMGLVFEQAAGSWRYGYSRGKADGIRARDHANSIGFDASLPIYMAIDEDVVTPDQFAVMVQYLQGAAVTLGGAGRTGVYGEADVIDRARNEGAATFFWQTRAWSRGRVTEAHLRQNTGYVTVGGIQCDENDVLQSYWGQMQGVTVLSAEDIKAIATAVGNEIKDNLYGGDDARTNFYGPDRNAVGQLVKRTHQQGLNQLLTWVTEGIAITRDVRDETLAAIEQVTVQVTPDQVNAIITQLSTNIIAALPPGGASKEEVRQVVTEVIGSVTLTVNE